MAKTKVKATILQRSLLFGSELYIFSELEPIYRQVRVSMEKIQNVWQFQEMMMAS